MQRMKAISSPLRLGRMIYKWIAMAEKDLVAEAHSFNYIVRPDITNYYNSVYTQAIMNLKLNSVMTKILVKNKFINP